MKLIQHRRNSHKALNETPRHYGVSVDVRCHGDTLIAAQHPFADGETLDSWLSNYQHGTLVLNNKAEGLENRLIEMLKRHGIEDYFLVNQSFPFLVKSSKLGMRKSAVRFSDFEPVEIALSLAGKVDWVWVDCFNTCPLNSENVQQLSAAGFKICLASPEMHNTQGDHLHASQNDHRHTKQSDERVFALQQMLNQHNIQIDAVCTDRPDLWL